MNRLIVILSDPLRQRLRGGSLRMTGQAIGPLVLEQLSAIKRGHFVTPLDRGLL